jgi:predicted membrane protein
MTQAKAPPNPYAVLAVATVLPGVGQVMNRQPLRGLIFVFFVLLLGAFTLKTAAAEVSFVGKIAGGLFVWALAMIDAYKTARIRRAIWDHGQKHRS